VLDVTTPTPGLRALCYSKSLTIRLFVDPSYGRVIKTLRVVYS